jgi:hypothetical protein
LTIKLAAPGVEFQVVRTTATAHGCGAAVAVSQWVPIYWNP